MDYDEAEEWKIKLKALGYVVFIGEERPGYVYSVRFRRPQ